MADAPQVVFTESQLEVDRTFDQPRSVCGHWQTPESSLIHSPGPTKAAAVQDQDTDKAALQVSKVLGLQRRHFWTLFGVTFILVVGTVGGSVGGVLAVQNAQYGELAKTGHWNTTDNMDSAHDESAVSAAASDGSSSHSLSINTSRDVTIVAAPTVTGSPTSSSTSHVAMPTIDNSCPQTLRSYNSKLYDCIAKRNANEVGDIIAMLAYTMQQCVDACSNMNIIAGSVRCRAVAMTNGLDYEYQNNIAANCWLKSVSQPSQQWDNATLAVLITDGE